MSPLEAGRLEQRCPDCGRAEAAGYYCTGCGRVTTEADWYPNGTRPQAPRHLPAEEKRGRGWRRGLKDQQEVKDET